MQRLEKIISLAVVLIILLYLMITYTIKSLHVVTPCQQIQLGCLAFAEDKIYQSQVVNINTADRHALARLKGIGPKTADKIIAYRDEHGAFHSVEEIMRVKGIGAKKYQVISAFIVVSD
jgi:comEA protein